MAEPCSSVTELFVAREEFLEVYCVSGVQSHRALSIWDNSRTKTALRFPLFDAVVQAVL
jgi:hypothetical protein